MALRETPKTESVSLEERVDDILERSDIADEVRYDKAHLKVDDWRDRDLSWIEQDLKRSG